jgi:O-antigen ligase
MVAFAGLATIAIGILLSGSREGLIGLVLVMVYYLFRSRYRLQVGASLLFLTAVALSVQTSMWDRFTRLFASGGAGRSDIWKIGAEAAKHRLLQGYGISNFPDAYNLFYLGIHQVDPYGFSSPAHNIVVHYLVELGIIGFALLVLWFALHAAVLRSIPKTSAWYDSRIALEGAFVAISFVSLTIDLFTYKYAWLVFSLIAILVNVARAERSDTLRDAAHHIVAPGPLGHAPPPLEPTFASFRNGERGEIA